MHQYLIQYGAELLKTRAYVELDGKINVFEMYRL